MAVSKKIIVVAGARPNFMKIARLVSKLKKNPRYKCILVHTGQHYDYQMSEVFFQELKIPKPDIFLNVGSGTHAEQTAKIMTAFEPIVAYEDPSVVVVAGDVNSTLACSLVAAKLCVKVAHIESGLRSFDRSMPEEVNRLMTDSISDYLLVSEESGMKNLKKEGKDPRKIFYVGNVMIDSLVANLKKIDRSKILAKHGLRPGHYAALTLHRPSNVDSKAALKQILGILRSVTDRIRLVYPLHPRTKAKIEQNGLWEQFSGLKDLDLIEPLGYMDFIKLVKGAKFVLTDSGGIQEETTYLKIPCLTMRENTERPSTVLEGSNVLVGRDAKKILRLMDSILRGRWKKSRIPKYWDGKSTERILKVLAKA